MPKVKKGKYQSKQVYLNAALSVIREVGIEKLTMRKVANDLDVSPMAIYKHFENKDELLKAVLDDFISNANVLPEQDLPWDEWFTHVAKAMYNALQGDTNWLPLLGSFQIGENALHITFSFMNKMVEAGFDNGESLDAYLAMIHIVVGAVSIQSAFDKGGAGVAHGIAEKISEHAEPLLDAATKQQIDISLPILVEGLKDKLAAKQN